MPLVICGEPLQERINNADEIYERFPQLKEKSSAVEELRQDNVRIFDPEQEPVLVVLQSEYAIVSPKQEKYLRIIATDDMTTCMAVVLRHSATGVTYMCHYDRMLRRYKSKNICFDHLYYVIARMHSLVCQLDSQANQEYDLYIVGGYDHPVSDRLTHDIIEMFRTFPSKDVIFKLLVFWSGKTLNTCYRNFDKIDWKLLDVDGDSRSESIETIPVPIVYGLAIDAISGHLFNCRLKRAANGLTTPMFDLRRMYLSHTNPLVRGTFFQDAEKFRQFYNQPDHTRMENGVRETDFLEIYDPEAKALVVPKLVVDLFDDVRAYQHLVSLSDQQILEAHSTSPKVEPKHFANDFRQAIETLRRIHQTGQTLPVEFFPNNSCCKRYFRLNLIEGHLVWTEVTPT